MMKHRMAMLVVFAALAGCRSGASTVPPPGTGGYQTPNQYYQPSATPSFTAPTYGAPAAGASTAPAPNLSANPSFAPRPNVSLANGPSDGLAWKSVTTQPAIGRGGMTPQTGTINPRTTLTTIRGTGSPAPSANSGLRDVNELPMVSMASAAPPSTQPLRSMAPPPTAPITTPTFSTPAPAPFIPAATGGGRPVVDPWRGR